jgi:hypothetical protein
MQSPIPLSDKACYNIGMETGRQQSRQKAGGSGNTPQEKDDAEKRSSEKGSDESCRCKEVSEKTFTGMLRLMLNDLAFWKRDKQRR